MSLLFFERVYSAGTLQDLINAYILEGQQSGVNELLALHYASHLLKILMSLNEANILHADIKPDNIMLTEEGVKGLFFFLKKKSFLSIHCYFFIIKGLALIDFGRSIDRTVYRKGTKFSGDFHCTNFKCLEMQENRPWTIHIDCYGACSTLYMMLFGEYLTTRFEFGNSAAAGEAGDNPCHNNGKEQYYRRPTKNPKRYWQTLIWNRVFFALLNVDMLSGDGLFWKEIDDISKSIADFFSRNLKHKQRLGSILANQKKLLDSHSKRKKINL